MKITAQDDQKWTLDFETFTGKQSLEIISIDFNVNLQQRWRSLEARCNGEPPILVQASLPKLNIVVAKEKPGCGVILGDVGIDFMVKHAARANFILENKEAVMFVKDSGEIVIKLTSPDARIRSSARSRGRAEGRHRTGE